MSRLSLPLTTALSVLVLGSCGPVPQPEAAAAPDGSVQRSEFRYGTVLVDVYRQDQVTTAVSPLPAEELWPHLMVVVLEMGFSAEDVVTYDGSSYYLVVSRKRVKTLADQRLSRLIDCGRSTTGPQADTRQVEVRVSSWIEPLEEGALVRTQLEAGARERGTSRVRSCTSRGKLETTLVDALHERAITES